MKMQNHGKIILLLLMSMSMVWSDGVVASVSSTNVIKGDSVQLHLKATGDAPKFPQIDKIGDVFVQGSRQNSSSNMTIINGALSYKSSTTLVLEFTPTQNMTIPAYTVEIDGKAYKTNPIKIGLSKAPKVSANKNAPYFLLMHSDKKSLMVGETIVVSTSLSLSAQSQVRELGEYNAIHSKDFFIQEIGEIKQYKQRNRRIIERKYAITAKKEGTITLESISAKLGFQDTNRRSFFGMGTVWKSVHSNALKLHVTAQSQESDLVGDFKISTKIDAQEVKPNKPINLTIKIEGKGNLEAFEIPKYEIDGVMIYSDDAKIETKIVNGEIYSTYNKSFALISEKSFTVPAKSFSMLSIKDKSLQSLDIQAFDIKIKAPTSSYTTMPKTTGIVQSNQIPTIVSKEKIVEKTIEVQSVAWWMLALAFMTGVLFILAIQAFLGRKKSIRPYKESEALKILYAHISEGKEVEEMVRKLYARKNGDKSVEIDKKVLRKMIERFV